MPVCEIFLGAHSNFCADYVGFPGVKTSVSSTNMNYTREILICEYAVERASSFPRCFTNLRSILICYRQKSGAVSFPWHPPFKGDTIPRCSMRQSLHILSLCRIEIFGW